MKFPSIFRTATPMRFDIKPRYYDPIREELEERTSRIKKELEEEGYLEGEENMIQPKGYGGGIRGSFAQHRGIKPKSSNMFNSTAMIRTILFFCDDHRSVWIHLCGADHFKLHALRCHFYWWYLLWI